mmetsp:Transcript_24823/g.71741  ORF Transcript_24823/g.71741 Transcript_24823/m.71741 type:complete len:142 (-) Transcript_24823:11-436(-)
MSTIYQDKALGLKGFDHGGQIRHWFLDRRNGYHMIQDNHFQLFRRNLGQFGLECLDKAIGGTTTTIGLLLLLLLLSSSRGRQDSPSQSCWPWVIETHAFLLQEDCKSKPKGNMSRNLSFFNQIKVFLFFWFSVVKSTSCNG